MLDFNWKSTVEDVLAEHIYDKVTITSWDDVQLYEGDAFDTIDGVLLSRPVAELHVEHVNGYEWANIRLCQVGWQIENLPSYAELLDRVCKLEGELVMAREESERFNRYYHEEMDAYYLARKNEETALHLLRHALLKKARGGKAKFLKVANEMASVMGYGDDFFDDTDE